MRSSPPLPPSLSLSLSLSACRSLAPKWIKLWLNTKKKEKHEIQFLLCTAGEPKELDGEEEAAAPQVVEIEREEEEAKTESDTMGARKEQLLRSSFFYEALELCLKREEETVERDRGIEREKEGKEKEGKQDSV